MLLRHQTLTKMPSSKTNAVRFLDSLDIDYKLLDYEVDLEDLSAESKRLIN